MSSLCPQSNYHVHPSISRMRCGFCGDIVHVTAGIIEEHRDRGAFYAAERLCRCGDTKGHEGVCKRPPFVEYHENKETAMGRLSEYDDFERDQLRSNPREEFLTTAYVDGRNAARSARTAPAYYDGDPEASAQYQNGFDDAANELGPGK